MPLFNSFAASLAVGIAPGDTIPVFAATDTLAAGSISTVIAPSSGKQTRGNITWQGNFASSPTAVVTIYGSNNYPTGATGTSAGSVDSGAQSLYTFTNEQSFSQADNSTFAFYWAKLVSQSGGGALTLTAHVG
jgi:hypothetical protein